MKFIPTYIIAATGLLFLGSCHYACECRCHFKSSSIPWDTTITMGHDQSLSSVQAKCNAIATASSTMDTCQAVELK